MDIAAKTDQFVAKYNGQKIDEDGYYGTQCWDVPARFAREFLGVPSFPTGSGGAEGVYRLFRDPLPRFFDRIANSPDPNNIPRKGDIVVWTSAVSPPWGHIAVVLSANSNSMQVFEQNGGIDPNGDGIADGKAYIINRGYANVAGWLRFKGGNTDVPSKTGLAQARILAYGILGRNGTDGSVNALGGGADGDLNKNHVDVETNAEIINLYDSPEGQDWRFRRLPAMATKAAQAETIGKQLTDANTQIAALNGQIQELNKRPTAEQLEQLKATAQTAVDNAAKAQAELEKIQGERAAEAEVGNRFLRWLGAQLSKLPGINIGGGN